MQPAEPPPPPYHVVEVSTERTANNSLFLEVLGNGGLYSLNYERFAFDQLGLRAGISYFATNASDQQANVAVNAKVMTFPILASYYLGGANHKFQIGIGATILDVSADVSLFGLSASGSGWFTYATGVVGYRYIPHDGGFDFGIGFTPLWGPGGFLPWGGLHFGAIFGP